MQQLKVNESTPGGKSDWSNYVDPFKAKFTEKSKECEELKKQQKQVNTAIQQLMKDFEVKLKVS